MSCDYQELLYKIYNYGSTQFPRGQEIKELLGMQLVIENACFYDFGPCRPLEKTLNYWKHEWAWYMRGDRRAEYIEKQASLWSEIKSQDGLLNSNYGHLVFYNTVKEGLNPYAWAIRSLIKDKESRQAVITFNTGEFNTDGTKDYICTQFMHLLIRNNTLTVFIALRSSDAIFGLPNNMPFWKFVQLQAWRELRTHYPALIVGNIIVNIDSAHIYQRHYKLVEKMLAAREEGYEMRLTEVVPLHQPLDWYYQNFDKIFYIGKC